MIDPNKLDLSLLPFVPLEQRKSLPEASAIYFAIDSIGTVQYIGKSVNLNARWQNHHKEGDLVKLRGVIIAYLAVDHSLLSETEFVLISKFKPLLNGPIPYLPADPREIDRIRRQIASSGRLQWHLKKVMDSKGARTTDLAALIRVEMNTASRLRNRSTVPLLKPAKLDLICGWLGCQPGDLIEYVEDS